MFIFNLLHLNQTLDCLRNLIKLKHSLVADSYEEEASNKKKMTARKDLVTKEFDVFGDEE